MKGAMKGTKTKRDAAIPTGAVFREFSVELTRPGGRSGLYAVLAHVEGAAVHLERVREIRPPEDLGEWCAAERVHLYSLIREAWQKATGEVE